MVGVTSQGSEQEKSAEVRIKPGPATRQEQEQEQDAGNKIQGPGKTQHQGRVCRSECPLNTPV
ncbi:unnamed protein product [Staurois parvus]|uniref:Uncharacterized protein n=1 Tax=Staurois parvus TaxID=386267 RepID=A0ABN9F964_9NEOB|nr:unnamed protein product [Staurois parvus]